MLPGVAGHNGRVMTVINSTAVDPHDYQPSTTQAEDVSHANIVIVNGLGYDHWLDKLVASNDKRIITVNVAKQIAHKRAGDNEHVWYDPHTLPDLAKQLANQYARLDPQHARGYRANARRFQQQLASLTAAIARAKSNAQKADNRRVAVTEPVFDYALKNLGYQVSDQHFAKAIEDGSDPSPADIQQLQDEIINHRIAFLVDNTQSSGKTISNIVKLAHRYKVPVLKVTETKPANQTDREWLLGEYRQLIKIQEGEGSSSH